MELGKICPAGRPHDRRRIEPSSPEIAHLVHAKVGLRIQGRVLGSPGSGRVYIATITVTSPGVFIDPDPDTSGTARGPLPYPGVVHHGCSQTCSLRVLRPSSCSRAGHSNLNPKASCKEGLGEPGIYLALPVSASNSTYQDTGHVRRLPHPTIFSTPKAR